MKKGICLMALICLTLLAYAGKKKVNRLSLPDGAYTLVSQSENGTMKKTANTETAISFEAKTKTVSIYLGCNRIAGSFEVVNKNTVKAAIVSSTRMACTGDIEDRFKNNFSKINRCISTGNTVSLYAGNKIIMILQKKAAPAESTTGQSIDGDYQLTSLLDGNTMNTGNYSKTRISIQNKAISCNVGCNSIRSEFKTEENKILSLKLTMTEMFCEKVDALERLFVERLQSVDSFELHGSLLEFYAQKKKVMVLKRKDN